MARLSTDVLVVGAGAAGIYAALEAQRAGLGVLLVDKSLVGEGGATVMAQMTVAAALGHEEPDDPALHFEDTLAGGRGLAIPPLVELLCSDAPHRLLETREMGVHWASTGERFRQVGAPGHSRMRCCYVDVLATGTGVSRGLKAELRRRRIESIPNTVVTDLITGRDGAVVGAAALDVASGEAVEIWARATVLAGGGLTEMYLRNSASRNMTGDAYALALDVGAELMDMEMVQFFPIAHLAPRLIGLDPILWDPFRYRLGGRLLNGEREEFIEHYSDVADRGRYTATRDIVTYAILKEVEEGRGSPAGGVWLDFTDLSFETIRAAFPPVVDKLMAQGIDLTKRAVEVAPMAHYTIGGIRADENMRTSVPQLLAAGEAVAGAHGANRLSGNAITEAFTFGARAGVTAALDAAKTGGPPDPAARRAMEDRIGAVQALRGRNESGVPLPRLRRRLQEIMQTDVGPLRVDAKLRRAEADLASLSDQLEHEARVGAGTVFNTEWVERIEMRNMLRVAGAVRLAALERRESRGAHQREDYPGADPGLTLNSVITAENDVLSHNFVEVASPVGSGVARAAN